MEDLLTKLADIADDDVQVQDTLDLEWESREAIRQANKNLKIFGEPTHVNRLRGGSVVWIDLDKPMPFSEIIVEDTPPYGLFFGEKSYSSFTLIMRLTKININVPSHLATYNYNNGKLTCHTINWKEAVVLATAISLEDYGGIRNAEEMWKAWRKTKDVTDFVTYLIGDDNSSEFFSEETEDVSPLPITTVQREKQEKKLLNEKENSVDDLEHNSHPRASSASDGHREMISGRQSGTKGIDKKDKSSIAVNLTTSAKLENEAIDRNNTPNQKKEVKNIRPVVIMKSPDGKPRGKPRVQSPPRSPIKTLVNKKSIVSVDELNGKRSETIHTNSVTSVDDQNGRKLVVSKKISPNSK